MKTKAFIIGILVLLSFTFLYAESFEDFMKEQEKGTQQEKEEFERYKEEIEVEYRVYKDIVEQEYKNYKNEILKHWKEPEISEAKKWVEYSPDFKIKKVVDFELGYIKIGVIVDKKEKKIVKEKVFKNVFKDVLLEDKKTAFERDMLAQAIEKKVTEKVKNIKKDDVDKKPILTSIVTGKQKPTDEEVEKNIVNLFKKAKVEESPSIVNDSKVLTLTVRWPSKGIFNKAKEYKSTVEKIAGENKIEASLGLAVIHTESSFNPMAKSFVPAYGLMQIVPQTAGKDVTEKLFGKPFLLTPSYLYNDENNIKIGTAYIGILYYNYLKGIKNKESRLYCLIAAYNTGAGNVAKAFIGNNNITKALDVINSMSSEDVYKTLLKKLPHKETINYLKKVLERKEIYTNL